jgi:RNA polymerase sigma-70 factor (ECF subfamily)
MLARPRLRLASRSHTLIGVPETGPLTRARAVDAEAARDLDAVARMAAGDTGSLAELYDRHATPVYSLALRIVSRPEDAEDVTQQVFTQAWRSAGRYDPDRGAVAAWLLVMARTRALDCLRRRSTTPAGDADTERIAAIPDPGPSVEYVVATREQVASVRQALDLLPDDQRLALELAYYRGLTQTEIAERTATPLGTVKTRVRTALRSLRAAMTSASAAGDRR